jgi:spore maturation protein CgeB
MKLLLIGTDEVWAIENYFIKYLSKWLPDIQLFRLNIFSKKYSTLYKVVNKLDFNKNFFLNNLNKSLIQTVKEYRPDVVLVFKGMEIYPSTLLKLKDMGIKLANYNLDHPFNFSSRGSGNRNVLNSFSLYDLHISYSTRIIQEIKDKCDIPSKFLPFGFDLEEDLYEEIQTKEEIVKCCFVGTPDKTRYQLIKDLLDAGIAIDLYANDWKSFFSTSNKLLRIFPSVYSVDYWKAVAAYRVQLNIFRPHNYNSHNMRSFEIPGAGAIQVAPFSQEHLLFFEEDKEIFLYRKAEELPVLIKKILEMDKDESLLIRKNARERSVNGGYSYANRSQQLLSYLNALYHS